MSHIEEVTCPLCMEVMDLTDRQFKPCECGYEICVWCWHHIIQMAEMDKTDGCCPACRKCYDKDRILGMTISSDRLAELNFERKQKLKKKCKDVSGMRKMNSEKQKLQKTKSEIIESRKELATVRVIQRNVVYIANVPIKLANEETFRKKEFLGQYGKVIKIVSHAVVDNQRFPSSRVVFATFSKEEEALRCIQSLEGYILDGYPLKVCFGARRYCDLWLRNMRCYNPDCFYLHEAGSQEDTCTKDKLISACASKLQQRSGIALNNFNRRSGSFLPPPIDSFCSSSNIRTSKCLGHSVDYSPVIDSKSSPRNYGSGRSGAHPVSTSCESRITSTESRITPTISSSSSLSATGMEAHIQAQPWDTNQSNKQIISLNDAMPLSNGLLNKFSSSKSNVEKGFPGNSIVPNCKTSGETNIERKDFTDERRSKPYSSDSNSIRCCTADETRQTTSCCCSWCLDITPGGLHSAIESPNASIQDTPLPNLQAITLGPVLGDATSSDNVPLSSNRYRGCSDLESTESASNFEAKTNSLPFCNRLPRASSTSISDKTIIGRKVSGGCSTHSAVSIGLSPREGHEMLHTESSCCDMRDSEHQYISCSEKPISVKKDMVQGSGVLDKVNVISKEGSSESDILSLDLGLVDHIKPPSRVKMFCDANKTGECSRRSNSCMSGDSNESKSFARMDNSDLAKPSFYLSSDPRKHSGQLDSCGKKAFDTNKSLLGLTGYDTNNSEVFNSKHSLSAAKVANESKLTWSFHHSASPVSRPEVPPLPRHPPGFHPIHAADDRPFSVPTYSGSTDQYPFPGNSPCVSSTETLVLSRGKLPQSTVQLNFPNDGSNFGILSETDPVLPFQSRLGNLIQDSMVSFDESTGGLVKNTALQEVMKNFYGHRESCNMGSSAAAVSGVVGISGYSGAAIPNDGIFGSQQFISPFLGRDELKFETPHFSYFHYSQFGRS